MNAPTELAVAVPEFAVGAFPDMPAEQYHRIEAMSASGAKKILRSPAHYRLTRDTPNEPTEAMEFGTVVHCGVLEPEQLAERVVRGERFDRRTKDGKAAHAAFQAAHAGKIILDPEAHARALACIEAVHAHPSARRLLDGAQTELSLFWSDGQYRVPCKCRFDGVNHGGGIDLKTTTDASPEAFARSIASFQYHVQAAHYLSGAEHVLDETPAFFAFIAVESEPPHAVACYVLEPNGILAGQRLMAEALARYRDALAAGSWRAYPDTIETLQLPRWATRFY